MDKDEFFKKLNEFAELTVVKPPRNGNTRESNEPSTVWRGGQEFEIDRKDNPTLNIGVKKLKQQPQPCEDCGLEVVGRRVTRSLYTFPVKHWRKACQACQQVCNPETGKFDIDLTRSPAFFVAFFRDRNK